MDAILALIAPAESGKAGRPWCVNCRRPEAGPPGTKHSCEGHGRRPSRSVCAKVSERDGWICQLCGEPVDPRLPKDHPYGASVDHRNPCSRGGLHLAENLQLAHRLCDSQGGTTPLENFTTEELHIVMRALFEHAFARYLRTHPYAAPEDTLAVIERRREKRRRARQRRRERDKAAALLDVVATSARPDDGALAIFG